MLKERIIAENVKEPAPGMWSNCLKVGNQVYISGMTARQPDGGPVAAGLSELGTEPKRSGAGTAFWRCPGAGTHPGRSREAL